MEGDGLCLDFTFFHIDLVASENDWDLLTNTDEVAYYCVRAQRYRLGELNSLRCQLGTFL